MSKKKNNIEPRIVFWAGSGESRASTRNTRKVVIRRSDSRCSNFQARLRREHAARSIIFRWLRRDNRGVQVLGTSLKMDLSSSVRTTARTAKGTEQNWMQSPPEKRYVPGTVELFAFFLFDVRFLFHAQVRPARIFERGRVFRCIL